jgi:hypothetical protein
MIVMIIAFAVLPVLGALIIGLLLLLVKREPDS